MARILVHARVSNIMPLVVEAEDLDAVWKGEYEVIGVSFPPEYKEGELQIIAAEYQGGPKNG